MFEPAVSILVFATRRLDHAVQRHEFRHDELCHNTLSTSTDFLGAPPVLCLIVEWADPESTWRKSARAVRQLAGMVSVEWIQRRVTSLLGSRNFQSQSVKFQSSTAAKLGPIGRSLVFWNAASFHWPSCRRATSV
jgi:hypothetical protein